MSEHDYVLANADGATFRADLNSAMLAIVSQNSKATAPSTTFAYMFWADTTAGILKQRNAADSAWVDILLLSSGGGYRTIGASIASASPTVIGTDGEYFHVTGTTGHSAMTVAVNRKFTIEYDGILTLTHGASIILPNDANFTTAAGDIIEYQATAANVCVAVSITKADGTAVVSSGGGWTFVSSSTASTSASIAFTGFEAGYDYMVEMVKILPTTDNAVLFVKLGISGPTYRGANYTTRFVHVSTAIQTGTVATAAIQWSNGGSGSGQGNAAGEWADGTLTILNPESATSTSFRGDMVYGENASVPQISMMSGQHDTAEAMDAVQFLYSTGNIASGVFNLWRRVNT